MTAATATRPLDLDFVVISVQDGDDEAPASPETGLTLTSSASSAQQPAPTLIGCADLDTLRSREFEVTIDKGSAQSIGLDVDKDDGKTIQVVLVKPGPVDDYNAVTDGDKVRKGDRILAMNGVEGSVPAMLESLSQSKRVVFKIRRVEEFSITIEKSAANEKLGIDVDHANGNSLKVISVGKLSRGDHVIPKQMELIESLKAEGSHNRAGLVTKVHGDMTVDVEFKRDAQGTAGETQATVYAKLPMRWLAKADYCRGPVERYNHQVANDLRLQEGDMIIEANGVSGAGGKVAKLLSTISSSAKVMILVKRKDEDSCGSAGSETLATQQPDLQHVSG